MVVIYTKNYPKSIKWNDPRRGVSNGICYIETRCNRWTDNLKVGSGNFTKKTNKFWMVPRNYHFTSGMRSVNGYKDSSKWQEFDQKYPPSLPFE